MDKRCFGCMKPKQNHPVCEHCGFDERTRNNKHQLPIGTEVGGQYILGRVLGQGGFGITYIGWDMVMNQTVAVKEYFPSGFAGRDTYDFTVSSYDNQDRNAFESNKKRFLREAEALGKLWNIPQIVKILRCFQENGTAYIVMEYVEGMDLRRYVKKLGRPMTMEETMAILGPVIEALEHVHNANLVHRDISPDNIMVLPDGSTKLLDFGAARYVENADAEKDRNTSTQAILKHGFAPPEQYRSHGALGPWTDVYAMCATIYYCLTGRIPPEAMARVMEGVQINWSGIPSLPGKQKAVLEKGLAVQPKDRYPSAKELWEKLSPSKKEVKEKARSKPKSKRKTGRNTGFLVAAAAVLAVIVCTGLFTGKHEPETTPEPVVQETAPAGRPAPTEPALEIETLLEFENARLGESHSIEILSRHEAASVQWSSSDPQVAEVSNKGKVTAVGYGKAVITARYQGQTASCTVYVDLTPNIVCTYKGNETGITITGYQGTVPSEMILPRKIDGKPVTAIGKQAFRSCTTLTDLIIPEGVVTLEANAFYKFGTLRSVSLPQSLRYIGNNCFYGCHNLLSVSIPEGVEAIPEYAFYNCSVLQEVTVPDSVTYIGSAAFANCYKLTQISISEACEYQIDPNFTPPSFPFNCTIHLRPASVTETSSGPAIQVPETTAPAQPVSDGNFICTYETNESGVTITGYEGDLPKDVILPSRVNGMPVTAIGERAFWQCAGITSVLIPEGIASIGDNAFYKCTGLTAVTIPSSVAAVGNNAFFQCQNLSTVTIENGVVQIGAFAFAQCRSITEVYFPESVTSIGSGAFNHCPNLRAVSVPKGCNYHAESGSYHASFPDSCGVTVYS